MKKRISLYSTILFVIIITSCRKSKELKTPSGFRYILYTSSNGIKPQPGDYITISLLARTEEDSVLFDSRKKSEPLRFSLDNIPFPGSYEEGLLELSKGDSATFFVPADSLYRYLCIAAGRIIPREKTLFRKGSFVRYDVTLLNVQNYVDAEQEIAINQGRLESAEKVLIDSFITRQTPPFIRDSSGCYYTRIISSGGRKISAGEKVTVLYSASFLNGLSFDTIHSQRNPYSFVTGSGKMIPSWEIMMKKLFTGDEVEFLSPSSLAYGEEGLRNMTTGDYLVPPFCPLLFKVRILSAEIQPQEASLDTSVTQ